MTLRSYSVFLVIGVGTLFMACQHEPLVDPNPSNTGNSGGGGGSGGIDTTSSTINCSPDSVYFANDVMPILQSNCAFSGCHGGGSAQDGVDLSSYDQIIRTGEVSPFNAGRSDLIEVMLDNDPDDVMPPPPAARLSAEQIQLISDWINQGAQENSCSSCDTTTFSFSMAVQPTIISYCQGCHSGSNPGGGISLTNYQEIVTQSQSGALLGSVTGASGYVAMPFNQPALDACKVDQIRRWIAAGTPDN